MSHFQDCSQPPGGRAILLSIKPKYADLILAGEKRVEFRRVWAAEKVGLIAIYASAPVQRIIALVNVDEVVYASPTRLWAYCTNKGGGLTRNELKSYFDGKANGYAVMIGNVRRMKKAVDPHSLFTNFSAPQSFRYLTMSEMKSLNARAEIGGVIA